MKTKKPKEEVRIYPKTPKKILFIHHAKGIGGAPLSLLYLIQNLKKNQNYDIKVIFLKHSAVVELFREENISYEVIDSFFYKYFYKYFQHTATRPLKFYQLHLWPRVLISWPLSSFIFAPKIIKKEHPDILHLNSLVLTDWCVAARNSNSRVVMHVREALYKGSFGIRKSFIKRILQKHVDRIIAISETNAGKIQLMNRTTVIYNPVNTYTPSKEKLSSKSNPDSNRIVYLGGDLSIKGFDIILKLIPFLSDNIDIYLLGFYPKSFALDLKNVIIKGILSGDELMDELFNADLLLVPTTLPHFPRPVIEAYMAKTPVIASNIEGMNEVVFDGKTGFLVKPDAKLFANKIDEVLQNKEKLREMGLEGYKFAIKHFDPKKAAIQVDSIYRNLLATKYS